MNNIEVAAHCAWDEYFNQMALRVTYPRGQGPTLHGSKYFKAFMAVATWCLDNGFDVRDYVSSALGFLQKDPSYLTPKDLLKPGIQAIYKTSRLCNNTSHVERDWNEQELSVRRLQAQSPMAFDTDYKLFISSWSPFESWFKVTYFENPHPDLLREFGRDAWTELQRSPALRAFLRKKRPAGLQRLQELYGYFGDLPTDGRSV